MKKKSKKTEMEETKIISIRVHPKIKTDLNSIAKNNFRTLNSLINVILDDYIKMKGNKNNEKEN